MKGHTTIGEGRRGQRERGARTNQHSQRCIDHTNTGGRPACFSLIVNSRSSVSSYCGITLAVLGNGVSITTVRWEGRDGRKGREEGREEGATVGLENASSGPGYPLFTQICLLRVNSPLLRAALWRR